MTLKVFVKRHISKAHLILFILICGCLECRRANATTYYFSNSGSDENTGTSKLSPWRTLNKFSEAHGSIENGDSILLERGSVFRGDLTITHSTIYLGAYGQGPNPVIKGSIPITHWKQQSRNVWVAECNDCTTPPANLFIEGRVQIPGRYPNRGYLPLSYSHNKIELTDTLTNFQDSRWDGANLVVRSSRWTIDNLPVARYRNKTFYLTFPPSYPLQRGAGYFIQNHLSTLDATGEWYFDGQKKLIYLYANAANDPNNYSVEAAVRDYGLRANGLEDIRIENISLIQQKVYALYAQACTNLFVNGIDIHCSGRNGMGIISCKNPVVKNSLITDSDNNGVIWDNNTQGVFTKNHILRTGLYAGRGMTGNGTYIALSVTAENAGAENTFDHNTIDSTGYSAVDFRTANTYIQNNNIMNFCLIKDDGAGIYTWGNSSRGNNQIEGNVIHNGRGNGEGTPNPAQLFAHGIYIDDLSANISVKSNTISGCATSGIFLHNAKKITLTRNTALGNGYSIANKEKGQLYIKLDTLGHFGGDPTLHLAISQNMWIVDNAVSTGLFLSVRRQTDLTALGKFDHNRYRAQNVHQSVAASYDQNEFCLAPDEITLAEWQRTWHYEDSSTFQLLTVKKTAGTEMPNLIANGNMKYNTDGWIAWPELSVLSREKCEGIEQYSLKVVPSLTGEVLVYHGGFSLRRGTLYRLTFISRSDVKTKLEFVPLMADRPWQALSEYTCFSIDSTYREFTYYFRANKNEQNARVNFKSNKAVWVRNVCLTSIPGSN